MNVSLAFNAVQPTPCQAAITNGQFQDPSRGTLIKSLRSFMFLSIPTSYLTNEMKLNCVTRKVSKKKENGILTEGSIFRVDRSRSPC